MAKVQLTRRANCVGGLYGRNGVGPCDATLDAEFVLPQFVAAALIRKISTNDFKLPRADREWHWFAKLPDSVIARIEQIVFEAFQR